MKIRPGIAGKYKLRDQTVGWPTPTNSMMTPQDMEQARYAGNGGKRPDYQDAQWPTPTTDIDRNTNYAQGGRSLEKSSRDWPTPKAVNVHGPGKHGDGGPDLQTVVQTWATPRECDWKEGESMRHNVPTNYLLGRQAPRSGISGPKSSNDGRNSRQRLNPKFVTWLMGLPLNWFDGIE